jgi:DNA-binding SARP family transcriptional activator/WD40 repeat protein
MAGAARIALLGPLAVDGGDVSVGPRDRVVLTALATRAGSVVSSEELADALWGERPPDSWRQVVAGCVMRLRRMLGAEAIETAPQGYRLAVVADDVDISRFEQSVAKGRQLLSLGECERAGFVLGEALALWRGRALTDAERWEPSQVEATRLEQVRLDAEELRVDACLQSGSYRDVLAEAQAMVARQPLRERRWALLATAQYQAGRQGEALRTLRQARAVLVAELGIDPGPELVALEQAILRQDPDLVADGARGVASAECPYRGLVPFDVDDADGFFGRDVEIDEGVRRLATTGVLVVVGPSGSGKSSLVRAGIAARLQRDGRRIVVITPGAAPLDALAALPVLSDGAVLVVDQCEEAVTLCADPVEQSRFLATLAERAERAPLVIALRADHLADVSATAAFARLVERGLYLLGAMGEADLRAAIEAPARQAGLLLEPGLVDLLAREVEGEPGALPLLSHALRQTWERREGRTLTVEGYRAGGGIRGAVAKTAEEVYEGLPVERRPLLRDLLLRLVTPSADGEPIRVRAPRRSLAIDADREQLIEQLVSARLVTTDGDSVGVAHEALVRAWPRLSGWLDDDVEGQRVFGHLAAAAEAWDQMGRPDSELYRGVRLTQALDWRDKTGADLTPTERGFLDTGRHVAERDTRRARRAKSRRRVAVTAAAVLVLASVGGAIVAVRQGARAETAAVAADARRAAALAVDAEEIDEALLLAAEAVNLDDSPDTRANLLATLRRNPALIGTARSAGPVYEVAVSPSGGAVAVGDLNAGITFHDPRTLEQTGSLAVVAGDLEYRPDGEQLAVAGRDFSPRQSIRLVDATTLRDEPVQLGGITPGMVAAWDLAYSGNGRFVAALIYNDREEHSTVFVWDVAAPQQPVRTIEAATAVNVPHVAGYPSEAIALSWHGDLVYVRPDGRPRLQAFDVATGRVVASVDLDSVLFGTGSGDTDNAADGLEVSPDGATLAVVEGDEIVLRDAESLVERVRLRAHTGAVRSLQFSPDGTLLASGAEDRTAIVWELADGSPRDVFGGHAGGVNRVAFSPDGATLYTVGDPGLLVWDLEGDRRFVQRATTFAPVDPEDTALPSSDGEAVARVHNWWSTSAEDALTMEFYDVAARGLGAPIELVGSTGFETWRPLTDQYAVASRGGVVSVWDWRRREVVTERRVVDGEIAGIAFSDDGSRIIVGDTSGVVIEMDADTFEVLSPPVDTGLRFPTILSAGDERMAIALPDLNSGDRGWYAVVDFVDGETTRIDLGLGESPGDVSPDGEHLAIGARNGEVGVVDLGTGQWVRPPVAAHASQVERIDYNRDGSRFASSALDGEVVLWDASTVTPLATLATHEAQSRAAVAFLDDGHTLMITRSDGTAYTWDTNIEHWIEYACRVAGRNLTDTEWRNAFGDRPYRETCPTA